jgi:hypothetical protein
MTSGEDLTFPGDSYRPGPFEDVWNMLGSMADVAGAINPDALIPGHSFLNTLVRVRQRWQGITDEVRDRHRLLVDTLRRESVPVAWHEHFSPEDIEAKFRQLEVSEEIEKCVKVAEKAREFHTFRTSQETNEIYRGVFTWMRYQLNHDVHTLTGIDGDNDTIEPLGFVANQAVVDGYCEIGKQIEEDRALRQETIKTKNETQELLSSREVIDEHQSIIGDLLPEFSSPTQLDGFLHFENSAVFFLLYELSRPRALESCMQMALDVKTQYDFFSAYAQSTESKIVRPGWGVDPASMQKHDLNSWDIAQVLSAMQTAIAERERDLVDHLLTAQYAPIVDDRTASHIFYNDSFVTGYTGLAKRLGLDHQPQPWDVLVGQSQS